MESVRLSIAVASPKRFVTPRNSMKGCFVASSQGAKSRRGSTPELRAAFDSLAAYAKAHEEFHVKIAEAA
jgi:hypothetical protein